MLTAYCLVVIIVCRQIIPKIKGTRNGQHQLDNCRYYLNCGWLECIAAGARPALRRGDDTDGSTQGGTQNHCKLLSPNRMKDFL